MTHAIVLAAGVGSRMGGKSPKVLTKAGGRSLLAWTLDALREGGVDSATVVVGFGKDLVIDSLPDDTAWVEQVQQLGTGHAVACAHEALADFAGSLLVTCGDAPLFRASTFRALVREREQTGAACTVLTTRIAPPHRYGRIVRGADNTVARIVETADATESELTIDEINTGAYCFEAPLIFDILKSLSADNAQGEQYLTDAVELLVASGQEVRTVDCPDPDEAHGVNSPQDLALVEGILQERGSETAAKGGRA